MIEFKTGIDSRSREPKRPTVAIFWVSDTEKRFCVIGTEYGYLHTTGGEVRTWLTYSGAYKAAQKYRG